jgi:ABC-type nitrate/sulfonate/bicarbonate transport system substrate-binding protein
MTPGVTGLALHEMAKEAGFFDTFGVQPNVVPVGDGTKATAALLGGSSDICMWSGFNQLTPAIERGAKLKIVAGALSLSSMCIFTKNDSIRTVKDLEGKTIGIGALGAVLHQMLVLLLRKKGVDPAKVTFRNVGSSAEIFKAVVAGTVDAGPSEVDVLDQQEKYKVRALQDGKLWDEIKEYTNQASYATDVAIAKKRDALVRTLAAYGKAYRFVSAPGSLPAYLRARTGLTGPSHAGEATTFWNWIQQSKPYATELLLTEQQIRLVQELNISLGVQKTPLSMAQVADMSLANDALKLLG